MANTGDSYVVQLKPSHLGWGNYRYTNTRDIIYGEGYIPIPKGCARGYSIYNSNYVHTGLGYNTFTASSCDRYLQNVVLLAQGCSTAGDIYAKQFSVLGNLQIIGDWYSNQNATTNNYVRVTWQSNTSILLEIL